MRLSWTNVSSTSPFRYLGRRAFDYIGITGRSYVYVHYMRAWTSKEATIWQKKSTYMILGRLGGIIPLSRIALRGTSALCLLRLSQKAVPNLAYLLLSQSLLFL
jgi:hypothetical protein